MRCWVRYIHAGNGSEYFFVDFRDSNGVLLPVGCHPLFSSRIKRATVFATKSFASEVAQYLCSIGYEAHIVKYQPRREG